METVPFQEFRAVHIKYPHKILQTVFGITHYTLSITAVVRVNVGRKLERHGSYYVTRFVVFVRRPMRGAGRVTRVVNL
jgi:hypothetical protein